MKSYLFALNTTFCLFAGVSFSQSAPPKVYINFVSHNEPLDNLDQSSNYNAMKTKVLTLASVIDSKGAAWNLQTCSGFVQGAITAESLSNNLFRTLATSPYLDNIEIDPRYKNVSTFGTMADLYHVLGDLGANRTHTLGGFLADAGQADWFPYETPQSSTSSLYPTETWQCEIMWGAASLSHTNDIDNWGIWKPDNVNTFYTHYPSRAVWYIGNGCSPEGTAYPANPGSFDSTDNVSSITHPLKGFIDSIQNHLLPWDKFYNYSITINQSAFGPTLFSKIAQICDSVNSWGTSKIEWSLLTDRLTTFQTWSITNSIDYSQWECGTSYLAGLDKPTIYDIEIFPNPVSEQITIRSQSPIVQKIIISDVSGKQLKFIELKDEVILSTLDLVNGTYFIDNDNGNCYKILLIH